MKSIGDLKGWGWSWVWRWAWDQLWVWDWNYWRYIDEGSDTETLTKRLT